MVAFNVIIKGVVIVVCVSSFVSSNGENPENRTKVPNEIGTEFLGRVLEKGRTLVHNSVKRFMVLLPVIFFKLGIAFTMLVLVTIVSVNNGFIGFLLLVVGLSTVLSRFQVTRNSPVVPYINPVPVYKTKYIQDWDRKDKATPTEGSSASAFSQIYGQHYSYPQLSGYYKH